MKLGKNFKQTFVEGYSEMLRGCRGKGVPMPGRSPAAPGAGTTLRWLGSLQAELEASVSDQGEGSTLRRFYLRNKRATSQKPTL